MSLETAASDEFVRVFDAQFDFVWRSLMRMGASASDAEDLAQDVFVVVHRRLGSYDRNRSIRAWLFGIARNLLRDHRRLSRTRHEVVEDDLDDARSDPRIRALEAGAVVRRALFDVPEPLRAILVLHDLEEVEMREVADVLDMPLDTAYARLRRGRELLREALLKMRAEAS